MRRRCVHNVDEFMSSFHAESFTAQLAAESTNGTAGMTKWLRVISEVRR